MPSNNIVKIKIINVKKVTSKIKIRDNDRLITRHGSVSPGTWPMCETTEKKKKRNVNQLNAEDCRSNSLFAVGNNDIDLPFN